MNWAHCVQVSERKPRYFGVGDCLREGSLVRVLGGHPTLELGIYAVLPSGRQAPAKVRAFVEFLAGRFAPYPEWDREL